MTTLAEHIIVAGAENRPLMLEKSMYDSWAIRIRLFIKGKKHGRMMLDSIDNGPLVYPTVKENRQTRPKKYSELTKAQQLQDDCDLQETDIIFHGLPPDVYALVNHQEVAKDIWDRVRMLTKGTELSYQECECRLYNLFDKFAHVLGETLYDCHSKNTLSEKETVIPEDLASSKLVKECNLNSETKDVHAIKYKMSKAKERCMAYFRSLHSHLQVLSKDDLKGTRIEYGFKRAFMSLFGQDVDTFTSTMLLNVDQLQKQLDKDEFQEDGSMAAFWVDTNVVSKEFILRNLVTRLLQTRFSPNKTSAVYEKTSPRSDLRWKPTGRIFKSVGLRWIRTGKLFDSCTSKSMVAEKDDISETIVKVDSQMMIQKNDPRTKMSTEVHQAAETVKMSNELDLLFGPLFDEYFNGENQVVLKSSAVTTTDDASDKRQQQP
ncbi:hypothetical protein Tco_1124762 [Tanacetum coccineum]|uniref:Integrase, catalytic region, zinc finger, CCHC-type, peptidase aspartic, catalytic n=1 Tax=Tanacetum coccineum TaxID=301880 RepID=A0ABQ5J724_9ASTR